MAKNGLLAIMAAVAIGASASADTLTWDGPNPYFVHEWYNTLNWSPNSYPDDDDIRIVTTDSPETTDDVRASDGGEIRISGDGTLVDLKDLYIGNENAGALLVNSRGTLNTEDAWLSRMPGSTGSAVIGGEASWQVSETLYVGCAGDAELALSGGGAITAADTNIAGTPGFIYNDPSAEGYVTVEGANTTFDTGQLCVGFVGEGGLDILNGASVTSELVFVSSSDGSKGRATVDGAGSSWTTWRLTVGYADGRVDITDGGSVASMETFVGASDGLGTVHIEGDGSAWAVSGDAYIGGGWLFSPLDGNGVVRVSDGATFSTENTYIGFGPTSIGSLSVSGAATEWDHDMVYIGYEGWGLAEVEAGAMIETGDEPFVSHDVYVGYKPGAYGYLVLRNAGTRWRYHDLLYVGYEGTGVIDVRYGAELDAISVVLGHSPGAYGHIRVDGADSLLDAQEVYVGLQGDGELTATDGATISVHQLYVGWGSGSDGTVAASGDGTGFYVNLLDIGVGGDGSAALSDGADGQSETIHIGSATGGTVASLSLDGAGTEYEVGCCTILADGLLELTDGASMVGHRSSIWIGTGGGNAEVNLTGTDTLLSSDADVYIGGDASLGGSATVCVDTGATLRAADVIEIRETGTLGGSGTVEADVITGGEVAPGCSTGTLTITGDVTLLDSSTLAIEIGNVGHDHLVVGTATLGGDLVIETLQGYTPTPGQMVTILDAAAITGEFAAITGWEHNELAHLAIYGAQALSLHVTYFGDATLEGCVDGLDYIVWSSNYLTGDTWQEGDFNGDGIADGLDYIVWSSNYRQGCPGTPGAVPEPATLSLLILGGLALIRRRR